MKLKHTEPVPDKTIDGLVGIFLLGPILLFSAFVVWKLWGWHAVPAFGLPQVSYAHALGLATLLTCLRPMPPPSTRGATETLVNRFIVDCICLLIGWLAAGLA
jgi:hypothetical protein